MVKYQDATKLLTKVGMIVLVLVSFPYEIGDAVENYVVYEGDVLKINVYEHDDLTNISRVNEEGLISMPLIGEVSVKGLNLNQVTEKITRLLADGYIVEPRVTVEIEAFRNKKITLLGKVNNPGLYELDKRTTLLELISKAQGLAEDAGNEAIIKRKSQEGSKEQVIKINLKELIESGDASQNIFVEDGDNIFITSIGSYYVTGEVNKPSKYKFEENLTVIQALTQAGGLTGKAAPNKVKIIRNINGKKTVMEAVMMDEPVLPEDVIVVPESFF